MVIAIDGTAGSGKSTVAKKLAQILNYNYIDSGALYRTIALKVLQENVDIENEDLISALFRRIDIEQHFDEGSLTVLCDGEDITKEIRSPEVSKIVSQVAAQPGVRYHVTALMHVWGAAGQVVIDGRDIGTYVFPNADYKFYIEASPRIRAERRFKELVETGYGGTVEEIEAQIIKRDQLDSSREMAPLKKANDAITIDTSTMTIDAVVQTLTENIRKQNGN